MRTRKRLARRGLVVAASLVVAMATPLPGSPAGAAPPTNEPDLTGITLDGVEPGPHSVTLVTGDTVTLTQESSGYSVDTEPARRPDGSLPWFDIEAGPDGVFVYPSDVSDAVRVGTVDRELFDVKYLIENGYADDESDVVPVIAQYPRAGLDAADAAAALPASATTHNLTSINANALDVDKDSAEEFWSVITPASDGDVTPSTLSAGVQKLWLDTRTHLDLDQSVPMIGAPHAWDLGLDGTGVTVAVLDTGIDADHPDLAGKVTGSKSFVPGETDLVDRNGHGTHVASTITGTGAASDGQYKGVAPGVDLMVGKVIGGSGTGDLSWAIDGMEWAATNGADVISMSLGGRPTDGTDAASQAVDDLTASTGVLFVIAAGNDGPSIETVATPGSASSALTVAAVDKSDQLADFSSRGPRVDGALKPDIAAPGVAITAARSSTGSDMGGNGVPVDEFYLTASGTSMATPHVAGAAAILAQAHPDWTAAQLKSALMSTSTDDGYSVYEQGAGRVDVAHAVDESVFASMANADFGHVPDGSEPASRDITYTNTGDQPVTLTLNPTLANANGDPAPDGVLTTDDTVTVPAGGTASATVTLNPGDLTEGTYTGAVVATDEATGTHLTTPVGLLREPPKVTLTIRVLDRDGEPVGPIPLGVVDVTGSRGSVGKNVRWDEPGVAEVRVPRGTYSVDALLHWVDDSYRANLAGLIQPEIEVTGDTEITLDARDAQPVTFTTSRPAEFSPGSGGTYVRWERTTTEAIPYSSGSNMNPLDAVWATPTQPVTKGEFLMDTYVILAQPEVTLRELGPGGIDLNPVSYPHDLTRERGGIGITDVPFTGSHVRELVDVGVGKPEDLAGLDLSGKLALLDDDRTCAVRMDRIHNLRDAGAAGIVAWPSAAPGVCLNGPRLPLGAVLTLLDESKDVGIPYTSIAPDEARALRDQLDNGAVRIRVTGVPVSPYTYEAEPFERGRIPESLNYDLTDEHVARIDSDYHAPNETVFHTSSTAFALNQLLIPGMDLPDLPGPRSRTEYVGPLYPDIVHRRSTFADGETPWNSVDVYDRANRTHEEWNTAAASPGAITTSDTLYDLIDPDEPVLGAHNNFAVCSMCRQGDTFYPDFAHAEGGRNYNGSWFATGDLMHLYQDGEEIPTDGGPVPSYTLPADPADYRLTIDDPTVRTHSEWTFESSSVTTRGDQPGYTCVGTFFGSTEPCRPEPLVFASYDLGDRLGMDNAVRAGSAHLFTVDAYHSPSREEMPDIAGLRLWYSVDDGDHWIPALVLPRGDGEYRALAIYPPYGLTSGAVSLKVEAWDDDGNRLTQTTTRAFELRPWHPRHPGPRAE